MHTAANSVANYRHSNVASYRQVFLAIALALVCLIPTSQAQYRNSFVINNDKYDDLDDSKNARNCTVRVDSIGESTAVYCGNGYLSIGSSSDFINLSNDVGKLDGEQSFNVK